MAEFLWTFAVQEALKKVVKLAAGEICLALGLEKEISKLRDSLLMVEAILRDVDRIKAEHHAVRLWVEKLEDVVSEADDLLDELSYEDLRRMVEAEEENMVSNFFSFSKNPLIFRVKMADRIKDITKELHEHYCAASAVGLVAITTSKETEFDLSQIHETDSFLDEFGVIGRETEVSEIVNQVIDCRNQESLSVIPIVGMGGLGKTAFVKLVFNHEAIRGHFDKTIWVCVSVPFDIKKILRAILETLNANSGGLDTKEALLQELQKLLNDKNYFLVLDDVWNEDRNLWNELKARLLKITQKSGSVIFVTTRSNTVAEIMETHARHHLRKLSDENCWSLFKQCAFANELPIIPELDAIQEKLVKKFGGIPLVVKALGGTVKFDENLERFLSDLESLTRIPLQDENFVLSTIKLSVDRLPFSSLKQCFAYCSNFPEDFVFKKEALIQMWIAQGFIQLPEGCNVTMEDIGDNYFNILLSRFLFQDVVKDKRGRIISCKMHDHIHDIACAISNPKKLHDSLGKEFHIHLSEKDGRKLRTLIYSELVLCNADFRFQERVPNFIYLRVLIVDSSFFRNLPDSIFVRLKHLRYFEISDHLLGKRRTCQIDLPESIVGLYNLQTLKLGTNNVNLPRNLRKLVNLRHLEFSVNFIKEIEQMPLHLSQLIQLQTLSCFIVGCEKGCKIEEVSPLKNLKGRLRFSHLENVKSKEEAIAAKFVEKENLCELYYEWSWGYKREGSDYNDLEVLEGLQPHKNLQLLQIQNFAGECLPTSTFVENLVVIRLIHFERCKMLPMLGQLPNLEELEISRLKGVKSIGNEFYGNGSNQKVLFPKLRILKLSELNNLEQWGEVEVVSGGKIFPRLDTLDITHCPELISIPNLFGSSHDSVGNFRCVVISDCGKLKKLPNNIFVENLVKIRVEKCGRCEMLPMLGQLPNLEELLISGLHSVRSIGTEFYGNGSNQTVFFPKLKKIELSELDNLEQWEEVEVVLDGKIFPHLESLDIENCPELISIPNLFGSSHNHAGNLRRVVISNCHKLRKLSDGLEFATVAELHIRGCPNLTLINLGNMHNLSNLTIKGLQQLPDGLANLTTNLKGLQIGGCIKYYDFSPFIHLTSLISLYLHDDSGDATQLPQQLEHLTALQSLFVSNFNGIKALPEWLGNLTSLESLILRSCRHLKHLPSKEAMLHLTKLRCLTVAGCLQLRLGEGDSERAKVSHVPTITRI